MVYNSLFLLFSRRSYLQLLSSDLHNSLFLILRSVQVKYPEFQVSNFRSTDLHCVRFSTRSLSVGKDRPIVAREHICSQHHIAIK